MTLDERHELQNLRKEIKKYRELESEHNKNQLNNDLEEPLDDHSEDEDEDENDIEDLDQKEIMRRLSRGPRIAVSAEVYGVYNNREDFTPVCHPKSEDQILSIKSRIIQSFLFNSLETKDLKIVIDAMEEVSYKVGEVIINQGEQGDCLYIVDKGELDCYKTFVK
jgi:cAMP-dependent protein kinase regulator